MSVRTVERSQEQAALSTALRAALVVLATALLPTVGLRPDSMPIQFVVLFPFSLPFWFAGLAAIALLRLRATGLYGGWAAVQTLITLTGAMLLPLWLLYCLCDSQHIVLHLGATVGTVAYLALLPAFVVLIVKTTGHARFARALWLNALGCGIYGLLLVAIFAEAGEWPGPAFLIGLPALGVLAAAARRYERLVSERLLPPCQTLPEAWARHRAPASTTSSSSSPPAK